MVKKIIIIALLFFMMQESYAQIPVRDNSKNRQSMAIVYRAWYKNLFRPKWYYWLFHNRYRKGEDRRFIRQHLAEIAITKYQNSLVEKEKDSVAKTHRAYLMKDIDAVAANKVKYNLLIKDEYRELMTKLSLLPLQQNINKANREFDSKNNFNFYNEVAIFKERHDMINDSYRPSAEKLREFQDVLSDMKKFYITASTLNDKLEFALKNKKYTYDIIRNN
ncbi:hypothetical protein [Tenacibaculum maritimum]|uniref:hypothetical protein n=1 Tax=Tenacibaculum maritimum TaxID=107401 RepID=UPI003875CE62